MRKIYYNSGEYYVLQQLTLAIYNFSYAKTCKFLYHYDNFLEYKLQTKAGRTLSNHFY